MIGRRSLRIAAWSLIFVSLVTAGTSLFSRYGTVSMHFSRIAVVVERQYAEFGFGSLPLAKKGGVWRMPPNDPGGFVLGPRSVWRPTVSDASMTVSGTGIVPRTSIIHVVHVPVIPWIVLFGLVGGALWWRGSLYPQGHCTQCGYDLAGSPGGKCPECGNTVFRMLARLLGLAGA